MHEQNSSNLKNDDVIEIDLLEIFYLFRRKLAFLIIAAVIGAAVAGAFTHWCIAPKYQSTSKIYIVSASNDSVVNLTDLQIGTNLTADYKSLILSRPMLESVIKNLKLDISANQLNNMLGVTNPSGTRIIEMTATTTDPQLSVKIANEIAKLSVSWLPEIMESNEPNIVEYGILPSAPCSPNLIKNAVIGAVILAVLYFGIEVVRYIADDTFKTAEEVESYFGLVPLASIPEDPDIRKKSKPVGKHSMSKQTSHNGEKGGLQ